MIRNHWIILSGLVLTFGASSAVAGDSWIVVTSDPPGAAIFMDSAYRGVTPQRPGDALRIQAPEGIREISAVLRIDGKPYAAQRAVTARNGGEISVQLNLRAESTQSSVLPAASVVRTGPPEIKPLIPQGELEVPGRNF